MDLHLLDLILKGKVSPSAHVLDAGCGSGRNSIYFLNQGFDVQTIDKNSSDISAINFLSRNLIQGQVGVQGDISNLPFEDASFDFIICSRVLHFANSRKEFFQMLSELKRVLKPKGLLYVSMASQIGFDMDFRNVGEGKFQFPDGSTRFSLTKKLLDQISQNWVNEELPRTVLFGNEHAETTLVLRPN